MKENFNLMDQTLDRFSQTLNNVTFQLYEQQVLLNKLVQKSEGHQVLLNKLVQKLEGHQVLLNKLVQKSEEKETKLFAQEKDKIESEKEAKEKSEDEQEKSEDEQKKSEDEQEKSPKIPSKEIQSENSSQEDNLETNIPKVRLMKKMESYLCLENKFERRTTRKF
jgi:hypothetical protein